MGLGGTRIPERGNGGVMGGWKRGWPGIPDVVFGLVLATALIGGRSALLNDPGTFWHVRLGRDMLQTGTVPRVDTLTATKTGSPWVDQSWAFDVVLAVIVQVGGWPLAVAGTALVLAWIYGALAAGLERDGFSPLACLVVAIIAAGVGAIHFLVRPHLVTFACVLATQRLCRSFHRHGGRSIWLVPVIVAVWANCHGGFLAGPLIVATAAVGHVVSRPRGLEGLRRTRILLTVFLLTLAAPLLNPYGVELYRHVDSILRGSHVTDLIDEYKPAPLGTAEGRLLEGVVLALVALPVVSRNRPRGYDMVQMLVWLHLALGSVRHAPLFGFAMAPVLATWIDGILTPRGESETESGWSFLPLMVSCVLLFIAARGDLKAGPDPTKWPLEALATLDRQPIAARLFHEQDWGGLIELECRPRRLAYLDDRFELWGRPPILEYIDVLTGGPAWDVLRDRDRIELVWLMPRRGLAKRLEHDPDWTVLHRDAVSVLFARKSSRVAPGDDTLAGPPKREKN